MEFQRQKPISMKMILVNNSYKNIILTSTFLNQPGYNSGCLIKIATRENPNNKDAENGVNPSTHLHVVKNLILHRFNKNAKKTGRAQKDMPAVLDAYKKLVYN